MSEAHVGFLYKIANALPHTTNTSERSLSLLKSYYLMRCKDISKGFGLPKKYFSKSVRCPHCCMEWKKTTEIKIKSIKLSKKQRRKIRGLKETKKNKNYIKSRQSLLQNKELEKVCSFCKHVTVMSIPKPKKLVNTTVKLDKEVHIQEENKNIYFISKTATKAKISNTKEKKKAADVNVYSKTRDVFSLQNKDNTISNLIKEEPKVIKNNKKKKDKFAGLCKKAVLASAKLKQENQNKLNLFLKPSS